jgi:hypothetical protein
MVAIVHGTRNKEWLFLCKPAFLRTAIELRNRWQNLPLEQRQQLRQRWETMTPEQRQMLRQETRQRHQEQEHR